MAPVPGDERTATDSARPVANLQAQLEETCLSRHLALFYSSPEAQLETVAAYLEYGLRTNHQCLYLVDANTAVQIKAALRVLDVDVSARVAAGDLVIQRASDVYLDNGFDPEKMIATLEDACAASLEESYEGLWIAGENTWCFHTDVSFDHIIDFEANFDARCPDLPVTALCQYDLNRFGEQSTAKALWTHEQIIYDNTICENPYHIDPEEYLTTADPKLNAQLMLEQTHELAHARQQVSRREERIAVLSRVLRHNIRNDLNVVYGHLNMLRETGVLNEQVAERVQTAMEYVTDVVDMADKARYIQATIDSSGLSQADLRAVVERVTAQAEESYPDATFHVEGVPSTSVLADTNLDVALQELLGNAVIHQDTVPPTVVVTGTVDSTAAQIDIRNPGGTIPRSERKVLREGHETKLEHGSGLGLWLVKWVIENSRGTLEFPADDSEECVVRITLQRQFDDDQLQ